MVDDSITTRTLEKNSVELKKRSEKQAEIVALAEIVAKLNFLLSS